MPAASVDPRRALSRAVAAGLAAASLLTAAGATRPAGANEVTTVPAHRVIVLAGHGWGHGHGMSQEGAAGAAGVEDLTGPRIASFYYPHTTAADIGNPTMRIELTGVAGARVVIGKAAGLAIRDTATSKTFTTLPSGPARWRLVVGSSGLTLQRRLNGAWANYAVGGTATFAGPVRLRADTTTTAAPMRVLYPDGSERDYRGYLSVVKTSSTHLLALAVMPMEAYLRGVVPRESPSSWPQGALRAQAIAARSYAEYEREHAGARAYDICDTTMCQVFGGSRYITSSGTTYNLEPTSSNQAVAATAGQIRTYGGKAIFAQYSASDGGWTTDGGNPYLVAQADPYDRLTHSSSHSWTAKLPVSVLESRYPSIGTLRRIVVTQRDGNGAWGGRVLAAQLVGTTGSVTVTGSDIYHAYAWPQYVDGLRSSWWQVETVRSDVTGDDISDVVTGMPGRTVADKAGAGAVAWVPGGPSGLTSGGAVFSQDTAGVPGSAEPHDRFGAAVTTGDFNGDGYADAAVGVPGEDIGSAADAGLVEVFPGSLTGPRMSGVVTLDEAKLGSTDGAGDRFGGVLTTGDFNGDGYGDLVVGAPWRTVGGHARAGSLTIIPGSAKGLVAGRAVTITQATAGVPGSPTKGNRFGAALAAGDVTGDGRDELVVGVPGQHKAGAPSGYITVLAGSGKGVTGAAVGTVAGVDVGNAPEFGGAVVVGDTNDDGHGDVVAAGRGADGSGAVTELPGSAQGVTSTGATTIDQSTRGVPGSAEPADSFGKSLAVGDVDGDGCADVVVGNPTESIDTTADAGGFTVLYGAGGGLSGVRAVFISRATTGVVGTPNSGAELGADVAVLDVDGDRLGDVIAAAPGSRSGEGSLSVLHGTEVGLTTTGSSVIGADMAGTTPVAGDRFGAALSDQ